jgi:hypothetical protein
MNQCKLLRWGAVLVVGTFAIHVSATESWDIGNNSVTYSVFQDNFELGIDVNGDNLTKSVSLSKFDSGAVASHEGGTAANYVLSSVVLSMNGTVYGSVYFKNNSASAVTPSFKVIGYSELTYGSEVTPAESYNKTTAIGTIGAGGEYSQSVNLVGSASAKSVTITEGLSSFIGSGTIETLGAFPVDGYFVSGGTDWNSTVSLQGKADIAVTYNYTAVPEPTSFALITLGCAVLALRRKRVATIQGGQRNK